MYFVFDQKEETQYLEEFWKIFQCGLNDTCKELDG